MALILSNMKVAKSKLTPKISFLKSPFLALLAILLFYSCNELDILETDAELIPYFEIFEEEGEKRGIEVDFVAANIEGLIQDINRGSVLGQCFRNERRPRKVIIDREYWEDANEQERQFLIFHELGHCFLGLEHDDRVNPQDNTCISIMHSTLDICEFSFDADTREGYLDELFFK